MSELVDPFASELATMWEEVEVLRRYGAEGLAEAVERTLSRVEAAWQAYQMEELTASEAAAATGYSPDYLADLAREGKVAAEKRADGWRFRRSDLPRKPTPGRSPVEELGDRLLASRRGA